MNNITIVQSKQIVEDNSKVCTITLSDSTVWELTDYMFVDLDDFDVDYGDAGDADDVHEMLSVWGWKQLQ